MSSTGRKGGLLSKGVRRAGSSLRGRVRAPATTVFFAVGVTLAVATAAGAAGRAEPIVLAVVSVMTIGAMAAAVVYYKPSHLRPWILIVTALVLFLLAALVRSQTSSMGDLTAGRTLLADMLSLPGYVLLAGGLLGFVKRESREGDRQTSLVLDGLIAALALASLVWIYAIESLLLREGLPVAVAMVFVAYPSVSLFLVVVTLRIAFNPQQEFTPAFWFMLAAMTGLLIGDSLYLFVDMNLFTMPQHLLNLPYAMAYLCAGAGTLHPSMRQLTQPQDRLPSEQTSQVRVAVVACALVIPMLLTLRGPGESPAGRVVLAALMLAMTLAAVARIIQALHTAEKSEIRLVHQAHHDSLTGLPNRRLMERHLAQLLGKRSAEDSYVAVLYLDLDRFKLVNDVLGHSHGDELLVDVARRLRAHVRPTDLVTRIGGDEFMIVLSDVLSVTEAIELANRLRASLAAPFMIRGMTFYVSASIGLAFANADDERVSAEALVRDADTAMYQAKDAGRDTVAVFEESMRTRVTEQVELENDLRGALGKGQFHVVYQPIVSLPAKTVCGVEALARWTHPSQGVVSPVKFIPMAEDRGMIWEIGAWVLEEAVRQCASWRRRYPELGGLYVSVNMSAGQLHDDRIVDLVADVLARHRVEGSALCLELTESVIMEDPAATAQLLERLRRLGVSIAIDDFGSEYSSLAYLKRFPVSSLKIDKCFVDSLVRDDTPDATLIATVIAMAKALDISTVAEGVETAAQAERLVQLGCDAVQGFFYSRPVGAGRLPEVVASFATQRLELAGV